MAMGDLNLLLAGRNKTTLAEGARCWVSGFRNSWPTYAAEYYELFTWMQGALNVDGEEGPTVLEGRTDALTLQDAFLVADLTHPTLRAAPIGGD